MKRNIAAALGLLAYTASARPAQSKIQLTGIGTLHRRTLTSTQARTSPVQPVMVKHIAAVPLDANTSSNAELIDMEAMLMITDPPMSIASPIVWTHALRLMDVSMSPTRLETRAPAIAKRRFVLPRPIQQSGAPDCQMLLSLLHHWKISLQTPMLQ